MSGSRSSRASFVADGRPHPVLPLLVALIACLAAGLPGPATAAAEPSDARSPGVPTDRDIDGRQQEGDRPTGQEEGEEAGDEAQDEPGAQEEPGARDEGGEQGEQDERDAAERAEPPGSAFEALRSRVPPANPSDVKSIDAIVSAVYESISGSSDQPRDWDRFRSLFIPGARMIPTGPDPRRTGEVRIAVWNVDHYIEQAEPFFREMGFYERELARQTERYGNLAHVFSTYESRVNPGSPEPFQRGVNSFQLVHDGERWWIVTIFWRGETDDEPLPRRYLPPAERGEDDRDGGDRDDPQEGGSR